MGLGYVVSAVRASPQETTVPCPVFCSTAEKQMSADRGHWGLLGPATCWVACGRRGTHVDTARTQCWLDPRGRGGGSGTRGARTDEPRAAWHVRRLQAVAVCPRGAQATWGAGRQVPLGASARGDTCPRSAASSAGHRGAPVHTHSRSPLRAGLAHALSAP